MADELRLTDDDKPAGAFQGGVLGLALSVSQAHTFPGAHSLGLSRHVGGFDFGSELSWAIQKLGNGRTNLYI
jgi:hypothetical protein